MPAARSPIVAGSFAARLLLRLTAMRRAHTRRARPLVVVTIVKGTRTHQLVVSDEGPGLSDVDKARALERFWRADRSAPGTGLGLPIAAELAKASGGGLALADSQAGGLSVQVTLRAAPALVDRR